MKAFEQKYDSFSVKEWRRICTENKDVTFKAALDGNAEVSDCLAAALSIALGGSEAGVGEATCNGKLIAKIMYLSGDTAMSVSASQDIMHKCVDSQITPQMRPFFSASVTGYTVESYDNEQITLNVTIQITLLGEVESQVKYLAAVSGCEYKTSEICFPDIAASASDTVMLSGGCEVKDIVSGVMLSSCTPIITKVEAGLDCATLIGEAMVCITYKTDMEGCNIKQANFSVPIKQELTTVGARVSQDAAGGMSVKSLKVYAEVDEEMAKSQITAEIECELTATAATCEEVMVVEDLFCCDKNLDISGSSQKFTCFEGQLSINDRVMSSHEVEAIDRIVAVATNYVNTTASYKTEDKIVIEGIVTSDVICCSDNVIKSVRIATPFVVSQDAKDCEQLSLLGATAAVTESVAKHKKTQQIDLMLEITAIVKLGRNVGGDIITEVVPQEDRPAPECPIEIVCADGGESLWDMAKQCGVPEEVLKLQNDELNFPLSSGEKVIIFHKI